jgi:thymidylate kinase
LLLTFAVDVITEHRRSGLLLASGETLLQGRQRYSIFWVSSPENEFAYLLAKNTLKRGAADRHSERLAELVEILGRERASAIISDIYGGRSADILDACLRGHFSRIAKSPRFHLCRTVLQRDPMNPIRCALAELRRAFRRILHPTGLFVVFFGPDGSGKSTIIRTLADRMPGFRRYRTMHWRPKILLRRRGSGSADKPHAKAPHPSLVSALLALVWFADYWLGYLFIVHPTIICSGLVLFDRYFDDVLVDPRRYRYGGPMWLIRILRNCTPVPDIAIVLDAPACILMMRKQEVDQQEIERQLLAYKKVIACCANSGVVDASMPVDSVVRECAGVLASHLVNRARIPYDAQ